MDDTADCGPDCRAVLRELELLIDGELDDAVKARVVDHLSACGPCMSHADFRSHVKQLVASKCAEHRLPVGLQDRLTQLLHEA
jgi:mycothiol system anti-sigma-R factor